jgi:hypothetical protein
MGFWSWLTGGGSERTPGKPQRDGLPELVLLTEKPQVVEVPFIQGAIEFAFGLSLPVGEGDATEFVMGTWPIFFFQFGGRLMQIKLPAQPYFNAVSRPFVSGNPDALLRKARADGWGDELAVHRAWIAVSYMNPPAPDGEDPYWYVTKMLGAFALADVVAIIHPARGFILKWDREMVEPLEAGRYKAIFGES